METVTRETNSPLPDQKKEKASKESSLRAQAGIGIREATYHIQDRARVLMTRGLPRKDTDKDRQDWRTLLTASIVGC